MNTLPRGDGHASVAGGGGKSRSSVGRKVIWREPTLSRTEDMVNREVVVLAKIWLSPRILQLY